MSTSFFIFNHSLSRFFCCLPAKQAGNKKTQRNWGSKKEVKMKKRRKKEGAHFMYSLLLKNE
jgi:hypothetical protein